jgi:hypothetical protein
VAEGNKEGMKDIKEGRKVKKGRKEDDANKEGRWQKETVIHLVEPPNAEVSLSKLAPALRVHLGSVQNIQPVGVFQCKIFGQ